MKQRHSRGMSRPCLLLLGFAAACSDVRPIPTAAPNEPLAVATPAPGARVIPGRYIVVLKPGANARAVAEQTVRTHGGTVHFIYESALNGFAASLPAAAVEALRHDPKLAYIEADQVVSLASTQASPPWGLDRIDQRSLPLNGAYNYYYTGAGVHAYIIDSGLRATHQEFAGRVGNGWSYISDGHGTDDCFGHGTHVAGIVGGATYGVAKGVTLHAVRVFDCAGNTTNSTVIAGVNGVTANASKPAVANMSLRGGASTAMDDAVRNSIASGVTYVVAAGNDNGANACNYSPARVSQALTVGSTTSSDARSSFSNIGSCLDLFAPGSSILSAWIGSDSDALYDSGTSMASPHVAGAAALYLETAPSATPAQVASQIVANTTYGKVTDPGSGSPNRLLFSLKQLTAAITGPTYIGTAGNYTWTVTASGGEVPGSYAYSWDMEEMSGSTGYWSYGVSSTSSYTTYVGPSYLDFYLFARVTSGAETVTASTFVNADVQCTSPPCPF